MLIVRIEDCVTFSEKKIIHYGVVFMCRENRLYALKKEKIDSWWALEQKRLVDLDENERHKVYEMFWRELSFNQTGLLTFDYVLENLDKP